MTSQLSKWDRVEAMIHGEEVDRVPVSLWRHFAMQEWAPGRLAALTLDLYRRFDLDLIKLTPTGIYPTQDWGPTVRFSRVDTEHPEWVEAAVATADEWESLPKLDVTTGAYGRELETIRYIAQELDREAPFVMTIYSPLTIASMLCWDRDSRTRVIDDLREAPDQLHAGLGVIRNVVLDYVDACLDAGVSGFFFATQLASHAVLTPEEYTEFGVAYDRPIVEAAAERSRITVLHVCGKAPLMFDLVADYPVDIINWADRSSGPSLAEARELTDKALAGGVAVETLRSGTPENVRAEAHDAIEQVGRRGFMLAPACVVKGDSPAENLAAMRKAAEAIGAI